MNIPESAQVAAEIAYLEAYMKSNGDHIRATRAALEAAAPHMLTQDVEWAIFRTSDGPAGAPIEARRFNSREEAQRMIDEGYKQSSNWEVRGRKVEEWAK